jgi:hypothetical protein
MADTLTPSVTTRSIVARRWPTIAGIAVGLVFPVGVLIGTRDETPRGLATVLMLLPLLYLVIAALGRRNWTWPIVIGSVPVLVLLSLQNIVEPAIVLTAIALAAVMWGAGHGLHRTHDFRLQIIGMIAFGGLAWIGLKIDVDVAKYVVAAGWLAHAAWDWVHLSRDRVVDRTYAECCAIIDLLAAVGLALLPVGVW